MRVRDLAVALAVASACASNPDPRSRTLEIVQRDGHGGWIVITQRSGGSLAGELISVEPIGIRLLTSGVAQLVFVAKADIRSAELWPWQTEHAAPLGWSGIGALSTISHGVFLIFSLPAWLLTGSVTAVVESHASVIKYPDDGWDKFVVWARFPQGLPVGLRDGDLIHQNRSPLPAIDRGEPGSDAAAGSDAPR